MIPYNPKAWFTLIFHFHKSDTFRVLLPVMLGISVYCYVIAFALIEIWKIQATATAVMHSLLGFVISFLLVFRTNTAYERWWEGRRLWGSLLNNARNLSIKLDAMLPETEQETRVSLGALIIRFPVALKEHLRNKKDPEIAPLDVHQPNFIARNIFSHINLLYKKGIITGDQLIILNNEIQSLTDITGACERIKKTPIPFSYSLFLKKFMFVYVMTMPFGFVASFGYWVIPVVTFVFYVLASLELIAEEIEDPFGIDANDLPTDEISRNVGKSVRELLLRNADPVLPPFHTTIN